MELYPIRFWCLQACCRGSFSRAFSARPPTVSSATAIDRKSTRLNSSHSQISYAVFCLKKKNYRAADVIDLLNDGRCDPACLSVGGAGRAVNMLLLVSDSSYAVPNAVAYADAALDYSA